MQDDRIIRNLLDRKTHNYLQKRALAERQAHHEENLAKLEAAGITTYTDLFACINDESSSIEIRYLACHVLSLLSDDVDRRRAVPALMRALYSENSEIRRRVIQTLGYMNARRAVQPLIAMLENRAEDPLIRGFAAEALAYIGDERARPVIRRVIFDDSDHVQVRALAIEWAYETLYDGDLTDFITLLSNDSADVRFWTSFALANLATTQRDITPALAALDYVAAYDHRVPEYFGWHAGREALEPLEYIHYQPYGEVREDEDRRWYIRPAVYLISPAPEYFRFSQLCCSVQDDGRYIAKDTPPITLSIQPDWLKAQLQSRWEGIRFDVRPDNVETYILSWLVEINGENLLGGLHRDGYGVVLTGNSTEIYQFAIWYRSIIADHTLYIYPWADPGAELKHNMTPKQLSKAVNRGFKNLRS